MEEAENPPIELASADGDAVGTNASVSVSMIQLILV